MVSNKNFKDTSEKIVDMLVGSTLKRHNIQLDSKNLSEEDREELKKMIEDLKQSVQSLQKKTTEKDEN